MNVKIKKVLTQKEKEILLEKKLLKKELKLKKQIQLSKLYNMCYFYEGQRTKISLILNKATINHENLIDLQQKIKNLGYNSYNKADGNYLLHIIERDYC